MHKPLVTIICTCYNHENYVIEALNSIKNQTYSNVELIIVDDCSSDNSIKVIEKWILKHPNIKFIKNNTNLGLTKSFNNAITYSKGEYLMDLAADDLLSPECIEILINKYINSKKNNLGIIYSNATLINEKGDFISIFFNEIMIHQIKKSIKKNFYRSILSDSAYMCSVSALYKRSVFENLQGYDERLYFEDLDYWLRVAKNYKIEFIPEILVHKRVLKNSMGNGFFVKSEHTKKLHTSFYIILKKAYLLNTSCDEDYALLKRIYKQSRWAIKTINLKYLLRYTLFYIKTLIRVIFTK